MAAQFSCIEIEGNSWENILTIRLSGKLTKEDYEQFVPEIERLMEAHDKIRILVDFHGWTTAAAWEKDMALLLKPFTMAKVKYFD